MKVIGQTTAPAALGARLLDRPWRPRRAAAPEPATGKVVSEPRRPRLPARPRPTGMSQAAGPAAGFVAQVLAREMLLDLRPEAGGPGRGAMAYAHRAREGTAEPARIDLVV